MFTANCQRAANDMPFGAAPIEGPTESVSVFGAAFGVLSLPPVLCMSGSRIAAAMTVSPKLSPRPVVMGW